MSQRKVIAAASPCTTEETPCTEYLDEISLEGYNYLSDIACLQEHGLSNLAFKYDEELRYFMLSDDSLYYYPSLNTKFPRQAGDYYTDNRLYYKADLSYLDRVFGHDNLFVIQMKDEHIISAIGNVSIPVMRSSSECLRVFEDYLSCDETGRPNRLKYDILDPRIYRYVKFSGNKEYEVTGGVISVDDDKYDEADDLLSYLSADYGISRSGTEPARPDYFKTGITYRPELPADAYLSGYFRLYCNYKKDAADKITLYVNYINYLNTPYVKIQDGKLKLDVIDGTYLKLAPGENGVVDIVIQMKYQSGTEILGYRNVVAASYRIWNVSDDKPKLVVKKERQVETGQYSSIAADGTVRLTVNGDKVNRNDTFTMSVTKRAFSDVKCQFSFRLFYDATKLSCVFPQSYSGFRVDSVDNDAGIADITVNDWSALDIRLQFKSGGVAGNCTVYADDFSVISASSAVEFEQVPGVIRII